MCTGCRLLWNFDKEALQAVTGAVVEKRMKKSFFIYLVSIACIGVIAFVYAINLSEMWQRWFFAILAAIIVLIYLVLAWFVSPWHEKEQK